jgi:hypothetical protein
MIIFQQSADMHILSADIFLNALEYLSPQVKLHNIYRQTTSFSTP